MKEVKAFIHRNRIADVVHALKTAGFRNISVIDVKGMLKAELKRRNVSYKQLAEHLEAMGIHETERNINNKISRGGFTAAFFVQCLVAVGCTTLHLGDA